MLIARSQEFLEKSILFGVGVGNRDASYRSVPLKQVDRAPVGEVVDGEASELPERLLGRLRERGLEVTGLELR